MKQLLQTLFFLLLVTQINFPQWLQTGPYGGTVNCFVTMGTNIFAGTGDGGVFLSTNNGQSWNVVNTGLTYTPGNALGESGTNPSVYALAVSGTNLFAGTEYGGVFLSTNNGTSWNAVNTGLTNTSVYALAVSGTNLFAGTMYGGIFLSTNNGTNWTAVNSGLTNTDVRSIAVSGTNLFAGTYGGVFLSTNNGQSWTEANNGLTDPYVRTLTVNGVNLYAGTEGGGGVFLSTNNGTNWSSIKNNLPNAAVYAVAGSGMYLLAGTEESGIFLSTDTGANWTAVNTGLPTNAIVYALHIEGSNFFAGIRRFGLFLSNNNCTSWTEINSGLTAIRIPSLATNTTNLFSGTNDGRVFRSTASGTSWYPVCFTQAGYETVTSFAVLGTSIFAGTRGGKLCAGGVYFSSDGGTNWVRTGGYGEYVCIYALAAIGTNLFYGGPYGISLSTDNGTSWTSVLWGSFDVYTFAVSGTNLFAGFRSRLPGTPGGVYLSTNNGSSWTEVSNGLVCFSVNALADSGTNLYAGTENGVFLSTNDGTNWTAINNGLTDTTVKSLLASGTNLFAGTSSGVFLTTNNGDSWNAVNTVLSNTAVLSLSVINSILFSGTAGSGVWRRPLSEMITDVEDSEQLPLKFALGQNFPNPFNPTTKIKYTIPNVIANEVKQSQLVTLKVYDILGNEVATLVNEEQPASTYEVEFNAANLPSGVYFYRLQAGDFVKTRKMILIK